MTVVPGFPLIFAVETSVGSPAIDSPLTCVIMSSLRMPAFFGGRTVEDGGDEQPARVLLHGHPDPLEAAADRLAEQVRLLRCEVVREAVVQLPDHPLVGGLVERVLVDVLVEPVLDRLDDLGPDGALVLDEDVADLLGQVLRVPAEEQPRAERADDRQRS